MKKLVTLLFTGFILMSCSAAHNAKVKEKIAQEYVDADKKKKVTVKTRSEIAKDKTPIVASKTISEKPNKPLLNKSETETLVATSTITTPKNTIEDYITLYAPLAVEGMKNYVILASIQLAQGILESGSGIGTLCRTAINLVVIKCKEEWTGESVAHTDDAPDECFRKYPSALDSYNDHSEFLANRSFYRNLFTLDKSDYKAWANGLKKAGYATDPRYPQKLISIIERYKLYEYDRIALNSGYVPVTSVVAVNSSATVTQDYVVQPGDTLFAISQKFNSSIDRIRALNNLSGNTISVGQRLIVQ